MHKQKYKVKKELGLVGEAYYNNYGIEAYLLENNEVFLQGVKLWKKIPNHWVVIDKSFYDEINSMPCDHSKFLEALRLVDPDYFDNGE